MACRARRARYVLFCCDDEPSLDIGLLFQGVASPEPHRQLYALSILSGQAVPIAGEDLELVVSLPTHKWVEMAEDETDRVSNLARRGVLLTDEDDPELARLRRRDETLAETDWNVYGALYHFLARWRGVDLRTLGEDNRDTELVPPTVDTLRDFFALRGPPPAAFPSNRAAPTRELPIVKRRGRLYDVLTDRKTTREFDGTTQMTLEDLATVLQYVFGCHGYARVLGEVLTLKRTSPSGGGLHAIEAYPLVSNVEGLQSGVYRYDARHHSLELLERLGRAEVVELATCFVGGQTYLTSAHVLLVLTARFERAFWKYARHPKAYTVLLMDAAHLSQTLYLVATDLGLGAWVTAAINNADIDERLGLDEVREGALAICGVGVPAAEPSPFDPRFEPFVPRETQL
jgi:putative peptide maturation dehydrogenase